MTGGLLLIAIFNITKINLIIYKLELMVWLRFEFDNGLMKKIDKILKLTSASNHKVVLDILNASK